MRRALLPVLVAAAALGVPSAGAAPETTTLIVPGRSIGKIRLGMTFAQVTAVLGRPNVVNQTRRTVFGRYVEYDWAWGRWIVGFTGRGTELRVSLVGTSIRRERTREGVGAGTSYDALLRAYRPRGLRCGIADRVGGILDTPVCRLGDPGTGQTWFPLRKRCTTRHHPSFPSCAKANVRVEVFEVLIRNGRAPAPEYA